MKKIFLLAFLALMIVSCNPYKKITYMRGVGEKVDYTDDTIHWGIPDPIIKKGDLLAIMVNNISSPASAVPFNLPWMPSGSDSYRANISTLSLGSLQNYLVDLKGEINYPYLGKMKVEGMTKQQLTDSLSDLLYPKYMTELPIITVRFANFHVTVISDQGPSTVMNVDNEKISIFEALARVGNINIHARKDKILLIRERKEGRETHRLDLRDPNILKSPYYWMEQGDVLYVETDRQTANSTFFGVMENLAFQLVGTAMSITNFTLGLITYMKLNTSSTKEPAGIGGN